MKRKHSLAMVSLLILTATLLSPLYIPSTAGDEPPGLPPYYWLVKITQSECVLMNLTFTLTYNCNPIEMDLIQIIYPEVDPTYLPYELTLRCTGVYPAGVAAAIIYTLLVPNDIQFTVSIDWDCTDPDNPLDVQTHVFNGTTHPSPTPIPFTIPFHWEKDAPDQIQMVPPRLVTFDLEPYFAAKYPPVQQDLQIVLGGGTDSCGQLGISPAWHREEWKIWSFEPPYKGGVPFATRPPRFTPGVGSQIVTFSDPDLQTGVVYCTIPAAGWVTPMDHMYWSPRFNTYFWVTLVMPQDGYGWVFTGNGTLPEFDYTNPAWAVDVDTYVFNNWTGVYWHDPSPMAGQYAASRGGFPDIGPDLIPGTADDGFGDGTPDEKGSSVFFLPTKLVVYVYGMPIPEQWCPLFSTPWPTIYTTATAFDIVIEAQSEIDGCNGTVTGEPMEFLSSCKPWKDEMCNVFMKQACSWSVMHVWTTLGWIDVSFDSEVYVVRAAEAAYIRGDADYNQLVDMRDIGLACGAYGSYDEGFPPLPKAAHPRFDARVDCDKNGLVDMRDIGVMCGNYGNEILDP